MVTEFLRKKYKSLGIIYALYGLGKIAADIAVDTYQYLIIYYYSTYIK